MVAAYNGSVLVYVTEDEANTDTEKFLIGKDNCYRVDFDKFIAFRGSELNAEEFNAKNENEKWEVVTSFVQLNARQAVVEWYEDNKSATEFGWIGNMWYPDSMLNKKVPDFSTFQSSVARAIGVGGSATFEDDYNEVTYNLTTEKNTFNGYFVLIILAIGLMFLQQFIMMRSQKAANELS